MDVLVLLLAACVVALADDILSPDVINQCPQPTETNPDPSEQVYAHPEDCRFYFICAHGQPKLMQCKPHHYARYSEFYHTCVGLNTIYDTCTRLNAARECSRGVQGLIGHPRLCHRYYNCSQASNRRYALLGDYEAECIFPEVFDVESRSCMSVHEATCGLHRVPPKHQCDYVTVKCKEARPTRYPSCAGREDGFHSTPGREWTKSYISCDKGKIAQQLTCGKHEHTGTEAFFSPIKKRCVSRWEVPRYTGYGLAPSCEGKGFGVYKTSERHDVYYSCPAGDVFYCEPGTIFNEVSYLCESTVDT